MKSRIGSIAAVALSVTAAFLGAACSGTSEDAPDLTESAATTVSATAAYSQYAAHVDRSVAFHVTATPRGLAMLKPDAGHLTSLLQVVGTPDHLVPLTMRKGGFVPRFESWGKNGYPALTNANTLFVAGQGYSKLLVDNDPSLLAVKAIKSKYSFTDGRTLDVMANVASRYQTAGGGWTPLLKFGSIYVHATELLPSSMPTSAQLLDVSITIHGVTKTHVALALSWGANSLLVDPVLIGVNDALLHNGPLVTGPGISTASYAAASAPRLTPQSDDITTKGWTIGKDGCSTWEAHDEHTDHEDWVNIFGWVLSSDHVHAVSEGKAVCRRQYEGNKCVFAECSGSSNHNGTCRKLLLQPNYYYSGNKVTDIQQSTDTCTIKTGAISGCGDNSQFHADVKLDGSTSSDAGSASGSVTITYTPGSGIVMEVTSEVNAILHCPDPIQG
jgi:hypothetical protein